MISRVTNLSVVAAMLVVFATADAAARAPADADEFSPAFLGIYRKVMEIEPQIDRAARTYGLDPLLARAVCMFESGGNANVTSIAGARGYFQVMPSTFRAMGAPTNIEAGVKYLAQLVRQFGREDYALAAYNGGPGRVLQRRPMPLESLQYVIGVGYYRSVLRLHDAAVRARAAELALTESARGDTWAELSERLQVPTLQLKLFNPFVTEARMARSEFLIAYPQDVWSGLVARTADGSLRYRARIGDNYFNLAFAFGVDVERLRAANGLWRLQELPAGMVLTIPDDDDQVQPAGGVLTADALRRAPDPPRPRYAVHRIRRGETLTAIARRYGTSVSALRAANRLGRRSIIRAGQRLRIPVE
jgi:LysM repeat protein